MDGKGILKFAPRLRDPACAGEFGKRNSEKRFELRANNGGRVRRCRHYLGGGVVRGTSRRIKDDAPYLNRTRESVALRWGSARTF